MAAINTRNVHRSHHLLGHPWGRDFVHDEIVLTGPGEAAQRLAQALASDKSLSAEDGPKPGEGPSRKAREASFCGLLFVGHDAAGATLRLGVQGQQDPGYGSTSRLITKASLCLPDEARGTPGGVGTPASALGLPLIPRLEQHAALRFALED